MANLKNSMIGIDIGFSNIKCIELSVARNGLAITKYGQVPISDPENPLESLIELVRECNIKSRRIVTAVSGREVIVRYISIPPVEEDKLATAVRFEADKYIPYDLDEVVLASQRLDEYVKESPEMKVLLVAAKKSLIEEKVQLFKEASLIPIIIDVDSFAVGNAFDLRRLAPAQAEEDKKAITLIDIGATKTNINIILGNTSFFTREIYLAGNEFTEEVQKRLEIDAAQAEALKKNPGEYHIDVQETVNPVIDDLGNEIRLSFDYFESQFDHEVDEIYVSGGGSQFFSLVAEFEKKFGKTINRWDPTEFLDIQGDVDEEKLKSNAPQLTVAVGLASRIRDFNSKIPKKR